MAYKAKFWDGSQWVDISSAIPTGFYTSWTKTAVGGETSLSGNDDNGFNLSYTAGKELFYLNGVLLISGDDYVATDGTSITNLVALAPNDVAHIVSLSAFNVADTYTQSEVDALIAAAGAPSDDLQPILANRMFG